ncbi:MAG: hypothetical protein HYU85_08715 [Chloroflexi bacterium]|nr:hypothetical protein [Chloroflexota bacterium]MBI3930906.1 hypothetical protein [Chloroflexota bacterium]
MLLIDGVKYELWTPKKEVEEFHPLVKEHYREIFGGKSIFIEGSRLESGSGKGSVPDGFVITFGEGPKWHIVEIELSTHQLYDHIVNQVGRFINGVRTTATQKKIIEAIYQHIQGNRQRKVKFEEAIGSGEIFKFISDLITKPPILVVIIENGTRELDEALDLLRYSPINVVEFQTFKRVGAESVHAHLFEPLYAVSPSLPLTPIDSSEEGQKIRLPRGQLKIRGKVTFEELMSYGLLSDRQVLYFYNTRLFTDERAQVIASSNELKYEGDGRNYSKSELAKILLIKHSFKHDEHGVWGPIYWKTQEGRLLKDLEEQVRSLRGGR